MGCDGLRCRCVRGVPLMELSDGVGPTFSDRLFPFLHGILAAVLFMFLSQCLPPSPQTTRQPAHGGTPSQRTPSGKDPSSGICPGKIPAHRKGRETNVARVSYWFQTQETVAHIGYTGPTADSRSVCNYSARKFNDHRPPSKSISSSRTRVDSIEPRTPVDLPRDRHSLLTLSDPDPFAGRPVDCCSSATPSFRP